MRGSQMKPLADAIDQITSLALEEGLDFFPMHFEICPADILYSIGAYGMPTRYHHWSFGKNFYRMKMDYDYNLSRIYELVINSNPCYAFLLEGNSLLQNKLIIAHVLGHSDFFKNNPYFSLTNRDMVNHMAVVAERIRQYEFDHGLDEVEKILDAGLSIQEHIDPWRNYRDGTMRGRAPNHFDEQEQKENDKRIFPDKDILLYIAQHSGRLEPWQRDILFILHDEMMYFWPQLETKIMNEGWATFWHLRLLRKMELTEQETFEFAKLNASVTQPSPTGINPYHLGLKIFEDIERKYGLEACFEARSLDHDLSFLRNYLTKDLIKELDLYLFGKSGDIYQIVGKDWEEIRDRLVQSKINGGFPYLVVKDDHYRGKNELLLFHQYEGIELDVKYVEKTLPYVFALWGEPVHLETVINDKPIIYSWDGTFKHEFIN
ncbi:SpoVR family protein [Microaerobacter geothermalis]|uniref:SpoVR family protein n=1 Tax=Microaerobacter geothermalis TaxID=674972 RepID=UPI001F2A9923|nr:SpoVR family protein [Microaerobacter geothermalis]MCF6093688.1 SpoVR family protein [Microaerobacter geothermalis]